MKVIIAGGRDFDNYDYLSETMRNLNIIVSEVVCGGANGADALGKKWAEDNGIPVKMFPAEWDGYGKSAGFIRNHDMAEYADFLVAFWDGKSHGTKNMIDTMKRLKKHGKVVKYEQKGNGSPYLW